MNITSFSYKNSYTNFTSRKTHTPKKQEEEKEWSSFKQQKFEKGATKVAKYTTCALASAGLIFSYKEAINGLSRPYYEAARQEKINEWFENNQQVQKEFEENPQEFAQKTMELLTDKPIKKGAELGICTYLEGRDQEEVELKLPYETVTYCMPYKDGYQIAYRCSNLSEKEADRMNLNEIKKEGKLESISVDVNQDGLADFTYKFDENGECYYEAIDLDSDGYSDISTDNIEQEMLEF